MNHADIILVGDTMISEAELDKLGLPRNSLKITHPRTGEVGYRAAIEVFHQLHCLNLVRQAVYRDYYKQHGGDVGGAESKEDLMGHVGMFKTKFPKLSCYPVPVSDPAYRDGGRHIRLRS